MRMRRCRESSQRRLRRKREDASVWLATHVQGLGKAGTAMIVTGLRQAKT